MVGNIMRLINKHYLDMRKILQEYSKEKKKI